MNSAVCVALPCEAECSGNGACIDGVCFCFPDYLGTDCSTPVESTEDESNNANAMSDDDAEGGPDVDINNDADVVADGSVDSDAAVTTGTTMQGLDALNDHSSGDSVITDISSIPLHDEGSDNLEDTEIADNDGSDHLDSAESNVETEISVHAADGEFDSTNNSSVEQDPGQGVDACDPHCGIHGVCVDVDESGLLPQCYCLDGWTGLACSIDSSSP